MKRLMTKTQHTPGALRSATQIVGAINRAAIRRGDPEILEETTVIPEFARIIDRETATELVSHIVQCDSCGGTGRRTGVPEDACRECGGVGENLDGDAIFVALEARAALAKVK